MSYKIPSGFSIRGDDAAKLTLKKMQTLVRQAIAQRDFVWWVRTELGKIAPESVNNRDWRQLARAVREFVGSRIIFLPDPVGEENLTPPLEHMEKFQKGARFLYGDCDDAATLGAAMGMAVGIPAEFTIKAFWTPDSPFQHVVTYLRPKGSSAIDIDTTRAAQKIPPHSTREFTMRV